MGDSNCDTATTCCKKADAPTWFKQAKCDLCPVAYANSHCDTKCEGSSCVSAPGATAATDSNCDKETACCKKGDAPAWFKQAKCDLCPVAWANSHCDTKCEGSSCASSDEVPPLEVLPVAEEFGR